MRRLSRWVPSLLVAIGLLVILWTFRDYGITIDEGNHVTYGKSVVDWYASGFRDRAIFGWSDVWLYGGLYDAPVYLMTRISPLDLYDTRHLCNALMGLLGVILAYRLGCLVASRQAGLLAALFLALTPRYYGHAFNDHKDIPFAVLYLWSVYWQIKLLRDLPRLPWWKVLVAGAVTGCAMGIRVGGAMLVGFAGLFWGARYAMACRQEALPWLGALRRYAGQMALLFGVAYAVMLVGWPWAQTDPLRHPFQALTVFSHFPGDHLNFFQGQFVRSTNIPWYYAPKWLLLTLPEFALVGLALGLWRAARRWRVDVDALRIGCLVFVALFPLAYLAASGTPLYNAARHFLFVVPPLIVIAALGADRAWAHFEKRARLALGVVMGILMAVTLSDMVRLHPFQSVYFNRAVAGGLARAAQFYDTDYYANGYKQGVRWLAAHVLKSDREIHVSSRQSSVEYLLKGTRFTYAETPLDADYHLVTASGYQHTIVPGEVVHVIRRLGVPLLYIIRPDSSRANDPMFAQSPYPLRDFEWGVIYQQAHRWDDALLAFDRALRRGENRGEAHLRMGEVCEAEGQYDRARAFYQQALDEHADPVRTPFKLGNALQKAGDYEAAITRYEQALALRPNYVGALFDMARCQFFLGHDEAAVQGLMQVLGLTPDAFSAHMQLGVVYQRMGQTAQALHAFDTAVALQPGQPQAHFYRGQALLKLGQADAAEQAYLTALKLDPSQSEILQGLATLYFGQRRLADAARILERLVAAHPDAWDAYFNLGRTYEALHRPEQAIEAYRHVLALRPDQAGALARLQALAR